MLVVGVSLLDLIISFIYIGIILIFVWGVAGREKNQVNRYLFPFALVKVVCTVLFVLLHSYYYKGGDTFLYFAGGNVFSEFFNHNPLNYFGNMLLDYEDIRNYHYSTNIQVVGSFKADDIFLMSKLVSIFSIASFGQYLATSILFTFITSIGIWKLFTTFCNLYPQLTKYFAIGILFYPTLGVWGSGILKDPITLSSVGFMFYAAYHISRRKKIIANAFLITVNIYLCFKLKPYILYTFVPLLILWVQGQIYSNIKSSVNKFIITPMLLALFSVGGFYLLRTISEGAGKYSIENVTEVAQGFHDWHLYLAETRDQSGYSLGDIEFTPTGILQKSPAALFVTYYRPFIIGDIRNFATAFEGVQSFILLIITIIVIFRTGVLRFFKLLLFDKNIRFFMLFAIIFGIAVGITSYNFGALSRYKIPSLPFFTASIAIIYYLGYQKKKLESNGINV